MEFLLFLTQTDKDIVRLIKNAGYRISENTLICYAKPGFFGVTNNRKRELTLCTNNIKRSSGFFMPSPHGEENLNTVLSVRETLRHEATHVAQSCNGGKALQTYKPNEISLNDYKIKSLASSVKISGKKKKEEEAYWMENKPKLVRKMLSTYCL